ncbi:MAG: AbrB/MazE/SpoVT family DNA-binding domain-containing protein [Candidatus Limnocylindria bacterium]
MIIKQDEVLTARARVTRQGQISVPKAVRDRLGLGPGDELEFHLSRAGAVVTTRPARHLLGFAGIAEAAAPRIPPTAEQIGAMIRDATAASHARRRSAR